jgi:hypothetical protein
MAAHDAFGPPDGNFETLLSRIQSPALRAVAQHWHEARANKMMPSWTDLSTSALSPYERFLWGFAYDREAGVFTGQLAGGRYSKWVDAKYYGGKLKDFHPRASYEEAQQLLTRIVTTPLAGRSSGRLFTVGDLAVTGERIILPMATDGRIADAILGASDYVPPPLLGPFVMAHENCEWYTI